MISEKKNTVNMIYIYLCLFIDLLQIYPHGLQITDKSGIRLGNTSDILDTRTQFYPQNREWHSQTMVFVRVKGDIWFVMI